MMEAGSVTDIRANHTESDIAFTVKVSPDMRVTEVRDAMPGLLYAYVLVWVC